MNEPLDRSGHRRTRPRQAPDGRPCRRSSRDECDDTPEPLHGIVRVLEVAPVDGSVIRAALDLSWRDFENAVCAAAAQTSGCDAIVSRDPSGFQKSPVPVIDPETALAWLRAE